MYFYVFFMIRKYISFTLSVQILKNLTESLIYFRESKFIRTLILFNFTNIINIETTVWKAKPGVQKN